MTQEVKHMSIKVGNDSVPNPTENRNCIAHRGKTQTNTKILALDLLHVSTALHILVNDPSVVLVVVLFNAL